MNRVSEEIRNRIRIAVYAYGYEFSLDNLVDDYTYDKLAKEIDLTIKTGNEEMDKFFEEHYDPDTGMWVHKHPHREGLAMYYQLWKERIDAEGC